MMGMSKELAAMLAKPRSGPERPHGTLQIRDDGLRDAAKYEGFTQLQVALEILGDRIMRKVGLTRFGFEPEAQEMPEGDYIPLPAEWINGSGGFRAACAGRVY